MKVYLTLSIACVLVFSYCSLNAQKDLSVAEFEKGMNSNDIQILDVRTQAEYNSGHLGDAFLADWRQPKVFEERVESLDKNKPVYIYCLSGARSGSAAEKLRKDGFNQVYTLEGGIMAWKRAKMPVKGVVREKAMTMEEYLSAIPNDKTVLVDIGAAWCPPCKKMEPAIKEIMSEAGATVILVKIDGGAQEKLAEDLGVTGFPTFIIYKNGKEHWREAGIIPKEVLVQQLK